MKFTLNQNIWFGNEPVEIDVPDEWDVSFHTIPGDELPGLTVSQIREKLQKPYGMKPLSELARGKKKVCIVFDDLTRPTPARPMAQAVLEELFDAGVDKESIVFLCALGTHGALNRLDFVAKLGEDIVANYGVFNHNCYENCVSIGTTKKGYDVKINRELMTCDLKIGLGGMAPHAFNGFSGGGKILLPGLGHIDTIEQNHRTAIEYLTENGINFAEVMGHIEHDGMRSEIEEMALMVGEFFKIDCIYNTRLEIVDIFAGHIIDEYYACAKRAQALYATPRVKDLDVCIANANSKASEASIATSMALISTKESGGDIVIVNATPSGQVTHYLMGYFGKETRGRIRGHATDRRPWGKTILFSPYPEYTAKLHLDGVRGFVHCATWEEVLSELSHVKPGARVGILADATMQYYVD